MIVFFCVISTFIVLFQVIYQRGPWSIFFIGNVLFSRRKSRWLNERFLSLRSNIPILFSKGSLITLFKLLFIWSMLSLTHLKTSTSSVSGPYGPSAWLSTSHQTRRGDRLLCDLMSNGSCGRWKLLLGLLLLMVDGVVKGVVIGDLIVQRHICLNLLKVTTLIVCWD
jgi:hypothetical protein